MPTIWEEAGFIFRFRMGDCDERPHVHVTGNSGSAKIWLRAVELEKSRGYSDREIGRTLRIARDHELDWLIEWEKRCGSN